MPRVELCLPRWGSSLHAAAEVMTRENDDVNQELDVLDERHEAEAEPEPQHPAAVRDVGDQLQ